MKLLTHPKLRKLLSSPVQFAVDAARNRCLHPFTRATSRFGLPRIFVFGLSPWKEFLAPFFPGCRLIYINRHISEATFNRDWSREIGRCGTDKLLVWGFKAPDYVRRFADHQRVPVLYVEDGFLRSVELGASKAPTYSLCIDTSTPYFDASRPSDLEKLLLTHDFSTDTQLMARAAHLRTRIIATGLSKYNQGLASLLPASTGARRILVLGQVEDDASIRFGCSEPVTNTDLIRMAAAENPGAHIIYKPHPDVLHGYRARLSDPSDVASLCTILEDDLSLASVLSGVDHVYTITSLAGFEAALRGIPVTAVGSPFYAGWGFTDDRQPIARRTRRLSPLEVFAGAYVLYPRYADPEANRPTTIEAVVESLAAMRPPVPVRAATG
jgi:capsular polysaccharide export protein